MNSEASIHIVFRIARNEAEYRKETQDV